MNILISVIIPTYKGSNNLSRAIDSVLNQTYKNIEIIIVDDNDPNTEERKKTKDVVNKYSDERIRYIKHNKNQNGAVARNTGIKNSEGEYITFLDDDDFMFENRVEELLNSLIENIGFEAVYSNVVITENSNIIGKTLANKYLEYKDILFDQSVIGTGSNIFISRKVLNDINEFDEKFLRYQDLEFIIRVSKKFKILNVDKFLVVKATNGNNNIPNFKKLKSMNDMYCEKFKYEIESLKKEEVERFYTINSSILYNYALESENIDYIKKAKDDLNQFRHLTLKENIYYIMSYLRVYNLFKRFLRIVKRSISKIISPEKRYLSSEEIRFIKKRIVDV